MSALVLKYALGAAVALGLAGTVAGYVKGRTDGRAAMLKDSIKAWEERAKVDDDIASDDPVALCRRLGGLPDECGQLRRLEEDRR